MPASIEQALGEAAKGLYFRSETDEPFAAFHWPEHDTLTAEKVRGLGGHPADAKVRETPPEKLFAALTAEHAWHGPAEKQVVQKYRRLFDVLRNRLSELKVFRIGEIEITLYIVGRTPEGTWAGLKTWSVET